MAYRHLDHVPENSPLNRGALIVGEKPTEQSKKPSDEKPAADSDSSEQKSFSEK